MKSLRPTRYFFITPARPASAVLLSALLLAGPVLAAKPASDTALPAWEQLPPAQRERLIAPTRERWNTQAPEGRQRMLERADHWHSMTPEQRERAQQGMKRWQHMKPEKRDQMRALFTHLRTLDEPQRKALMERWRAMTPDQRKAWADQHPATERGED